MEKFPRRVIVAFVIIAGYLFAGTLFFHAVEGWRYLDSFYFTGVTLTTVGYGDFTPTHDLSKLGAVFFAFSGVGIIFYSIGILAQRYFEREEQRLEAIWRHSRGRVIAKEGLRKFNERGQRLFQRIRR
jgi:voltage-gated potassium channel